jgi:hypothetical protein
MQPCWQLQPHRLVPHQAWGPHLRSPSLAWTTQRQLRLPLLRRHNSSKPLQWPQLRQQLLLRCLCLGWCLLLCLACLQ